MKRKANLFIKLSSFENLFNAFKKALKGSGKNEEACLFSFGLENNIIDLQQELLAGRYVPGHYRYFQVYEPKERTISVAPFRDRVVHHAVINVLEPVFEKIFIFDSYATRKGKGTHKAVERAQYFLKKKRAYLKFDISKYFNNINHEKMAALVEKKIKDYKILTLIKTIIKTSDTSQGTETGRGLPIGNLTSQFFANVYLDRLDHYVKEELGVKQYIRYMDDCVVFHDDIDFLKDTLIKIRVLLKNDLHLTLKEKATLINTRSHGLPFLGFRVFPSLLRIKKENIKRLKRKLHQREKQYSQGIISEERYCMSIVSLLGYIRFADSYGLRRVLFQ